MEHGYVDGAYVESCRGSIKHQRRIHTSQTCLKASHRHGHRHSLLHPVHMLGCVCKPHWESSASEGISLRSETAPHSNHDQRARLALFLTNMHGDETTARCTSGHVGQFFTKGAALLCGMVEIINDGFSDETTNKELEDRLMPRTEKLPLYTTHEFNDNVVAGIRAVELMLLYG